MKRKLFILFCCVMLCGCSTIRKSPNFDKRASRAGTVALIPGDVSIERIVYKGTNEMLFQESKQAAETISATLQSELGKKGYDIKVFNWSAEDLAATPQLSQELSKLKDQHASLVADAQKQYVRKFKWKNFKLSMGSDVNPIADKAKADLLVFFAAGGYVKSGGEIASDVTKTVLIGVASLGHVVYLTPSSGGVIFISVVDGDNGDILWHNFSNPQLNPNLTHPKTVKRLVKQVVKKFPKRSK